MLSGVLGREGSEQLAESAQILRFAQDDNAAQDDNPALDQIPLLHRTPLRNDNDGPGDNVVNHSTPSTKLLYFATPLMWFFTTVEFDLLGFGGGCFPPLSENSSTRDQG
jgi:hypothetical protein